MIIISCVLSSLNSVSVICCFPAFEHAHRTFPSLPPSSLLKHGDFLQHLWSPKMLKSYSKGKVFSIHWNQKKINELTMWRNIKLLWAILTRNCKISSLPWFILVVSMCMQKHLQKHIYMKVHPHMLGFASCK